MSGDMANAELGISMVDATGAKSRMGASNDLANQQQWSLGYLNERIVGMLAALAVSTIVIVWVVDTPAIFRYSVTITVTLLVAAVVAGLLRGKAKLAALRQQQMKAHPT
ncbi:MAG: hypothetical protein ACI9J2_000153 [Saprospiraceae bacterium]|jgi:hypothetical protein